MILFTGQSGIKVKECLDRISSQVSSNPEVISVEGEMAEIS